MRQLSESQRLLAVRRYNILDTPPDGAFDRITSIAARIAGVPISIISIVDSNRIWFKSHHGIAADQVDRAPGLCASAIVQDKPLVINDARSDPRTFENPLVAGEFGLRFYAGAPLTTSDGFKLGTLCVIDKVPRPLSKEQMDLLEDLASVVIDELELRRSANIAFTKLQTEARSDPLTGLPNRRHFYEWMNPQSGHSRRAYGPLCLAIIDIDHFKSVNDTFGHGAGDAAIKTVTLVIQNCLQNDDFAVRWGGDEFLAIISGTIFQARLVVEQIRRAIAAHVIDFLGKSVTVTVGATEMWPDEQDHRVLERVDGALYEAKRFGRNRVLWL